MTTSWVFISSDYVIRFWHSHLYVLTSELIQSKSAVQRWKRNVSERGKAALKSTDSELFLSEKALFSADFLQFWTTLIQRLLELIRSETALISTNVFHVL